MTSSPSVAANLSNDARKGLLLVAGFPDHANLSVSAVVTDFLMIATEAGKI
jgi:hypothetical protein